MKTKTLLIIILAIGLFLRIYQYRERFYYAHDNDLAAWIVRDIIVDHHPRLIGQLTSAPGVFIGPYFYYALIPFFLLTHLSPIGIVGYSWLIGTGTILSAYYVFSRLHGEKTGIFAALLFGLSYNIVNTEREIVPTTAIFLWSIWCYYGLHLQVRGKKIALYLLAILLALVWHIQLVLGLFAFISLAVMILHQKQFRPRDFVYPAILFIILSTPLWLFEFRHGFMQTHAMINSFSSSGHTSLALQERLSQIILYISRNINVLFWVRPVSVGIYTLPACLLGLGLFLLIIKRLPKTTFLLITCWIFLYFLFFSLNRINLSEYYLNGLQIFWISIVAIGLSRLWRWNLLGKFAASIICAVFMVHNIDHFVSSYAQTNGFIQRSEIVNYIYADAKKHLYPCVAISYMTDPGNNLGYRYLFWLAGQKTKPPSSLAPVYTIVFPHSRANHLDATFGALGLVLPDYPKYTQSRISESCSGEDANISESMFGFTK